MINSKLLQLYQRLDKRELREITKLLATPYFNSKQEVSDLFAYLRKLGAGLPPAKLDKQVAYSKIFPDKPYQGWRMRETMHRLAHAIEEYWLLQALRNNHPARETLLLEEYRKRQLDKLFFQQIKQQKTQLGKKVEQNADHFIQKINLQHTEYFHPNSNKQKKETADLLLNLIDDLDKYYLTTKMRYAYELKAYELLMKQAENPVFLLGEILEKIGEKPADKSLASQYKKMYLLLEKEETHLFEELKNDFLGIKAMGKREDRLALFAVLANFAGMRVNQGDKSWNKDVLNLYLHALETSLLIEWGRLSQTDFFNIFNLACALKEYDKAEEVINRHAIYLAPEIRKSVVVICTAILRFNQGNFGQTLGLLQTVNFEDHTYKLIHRKLLIQSYFELELQGEAVPLLEECANFRSFLYRHQNEMPASAFEGNLNFLKMVAWLADLPYKQKLHKKSLEERLRSFKHIRNRSWLVQVLGRDNS